MKTEMDMMQDVFSIINVVDVSNLINGVIIKYERPKSSTKKDVVVKPLAISQDALQLGIVNINVHVPNLENIKFNGIPDDKQPSLEVIQSICKAIEPLVDGTEHYDFNVNIDRPATMEQEPDGSWFANIRVSYNSFQNNFKNI